MKKYKHINGKYIAKQGMYDIYDIFLLKGNRTDFDRVIYSINPICKELIENSSDWIEMIEVPLDEYFSKKEIDDAFRRAHAFTHYNMKGFIDINTQAVLNYLKNNFFNCLKHV